MKPSLLALLIAAGAFGASTVYLAIQLADERARADQVAAQSRALEARIAELEKLRAAVAARADSRTFTAAARDLAGAGTPAIGRADAAANSADVAREPASGPYVAAPSPEQSEAFRKMIRSQVRAQNRRLYADVGAKLGLTDDVASRLVDLLTDHQMGPMTGEAPVTSVQAGMELRQRQQDEIANLIGYGRMSLFKDYQDTLPARSEADQLARRLESLDLTLDAAQRGKLVEAFAEERKRIPPPTFVQGGSRQQHIETATRWEENYRERTAARTRAILTGEQLKAYEDFAQWEREMRAQFEAQPGAEGSVSFMMAEPAVAPAAVAVPLPAPPPPRER